MLVNIQFKLKNLIVYFVEFRAEKYECLLSRKLATLDSKGYIKSYGVGRFRRYQKPKPRVPGQKVIYKKKWYPAFVNGQMYAYSLPVIRQISQLPQDKKWGCDYTDVSIGVWLTHTNIGPGIHWVDFDVAKIDKEFHADGGRKRRSTEGWRQRLSSKMSYKFINESSEIVYMVISRRGDVELRDAVRHTWASSILGSVIFPVAGQYCPWADGHRENWFGCRESDYMKVPF